MESFQPMRSLWVRILKVNSNPQNGSDQESLANDLVITWSPPDSWETPNSYRVYYSDKDYFEVQDTTVNVSELNPGTHGIMVSAVYPDGVSVWIGPQWVYNPGEQIQLIDESISKALVYNNTELLQGSITIDMGELADIRKISIKDPVENSEVFNEMKLLQDLEINCTGLSGEE